MLSSRGCLGRKCKMWPSDDSYWLCLDEDSPLLYLGHSGGQFVSQSAGKANHLLVSDPPDCWKLWVVSGLHISRHGLPHLQTVLVRCLTGSRAADRPARYISAFPQVPKSTLTGYSKTSTVQAMPCKSGNRSICCSLILLSLWACHSSMAWARASLRLQIQVSLLPNGGQQL